MKLMEFFGKNLDVNKHIYGSKDAKNIGDDLFWFILDHDKLHKDYFHPIAKKIKITQDKKSHDKEQAIKNFLPMVNKGCLEYYHHKKLPGKPAQLFSKELREDLCERLYDYYCDDIVRGKYKLG